VSKDIPKTQQYGIGFWSPEVYEKFKRICYIKIEELLVELVKAENLEEAHALLDELEGVIDEAIPVAKETGKLPK